MIFWKRIRSSRIIQFIPFKFYFLKSDQINIKLTWHHLNFPTNHPLSVHTLQNHLLQKPYDKHSKLWLTLETVNPCNYFIVEFLMRIKIKMEKQRASQYYCYNLSIESIKKYPLPILCAKQLKVIEGFGDFFIEETEKLIKKHYGRGRLPTPEEKQMDEIEEFQSLRLHMQRQKIQKTKSRETDEQPQCDMAVKGNNHSMSISSNKYSQSQKMESESIKFIKALKSQQSYTPSEYSINKSLKSSVKSSKYSVNKSYKPKYGSEAFMVLQMVYEYQGFVNKFKKGITKGEINQILFQQTYGELIMKRILQKQSTKKSEAIPEHDKKMQTRFGELLLKQEKVKSWKTIRIKLQEHGYIYFDKDDCERFYLTEMGLNYVKQTLEKEKAKEKKSIGSQNLERSQRECSQGEEDKGEQEKGEERKMERKKTTRKRKRKNDDKNSKSVLENHLEDCRDCQLNMLIDTKKLERNYTKQEFPDFIKSLRKKVNYELTDVQFGGFMWEHRGEIINAIAAILDYSKLGEDELVFICKQMSVFKEIATKIIIYEVKPNFIKNQKLLQLICQAKIMGFKIHKSHCLQDTIKILHKYYKLFQSLQKKQRIRTIGHSLRSFEKSYAHLDPYLLRNVFSQQIKQFQFLLRLQPDDIQKIVNRFKGVHGFLECLEEEEDYSFRARLCDALESSSSTVISGCRSIADVVTSLLTRKSYEE